MDQEVPSPCNKICKLNAAQVCIGCGRNIDEIALWAGASREQRLEICAQAEARLATFVNKPSAGLDPEKSH